MHLYPDHDTEGVLRVEGHGPVTDGWLRTVLGPTARFQVQPVLDLAQQAPVEAYEIPDRHRQAVHLMTPADTFPYGSCTDRSMQIDHTVPYREGGATSVGNYGPLTTQHHRVKTHAPGWEVRQPFPGIYICATPTTPTTSSTTPAPGRSRAPREGYSDRRSSRTRGMTWVP